MEGHKEHFQCGLFSSKCTKIFYQYGIAVRNRYQSSTSGVPHVVISNFEQVNPQLWNSEVGKEEDLVRLGSIYISYDFGRTQRKTGS